MKRSSARIGRLVHTGGLAGILLVAACTSSEPLAQPTWPAPDDPMALAEAAGLTPGTEEFLTTHTHAHLDVFVDGERVEIPAAIGIDTTDPGIEASLMDDEVTTEYQLPGTCDQLCLSPLHTHDPSGIIHTESKVTDAPPDTLGQFFTEWDVPLDASCVGEYCAPDTPIHVYLNGQAYSGDPTEIELTSHLVIVIAIGGVPGFIPDTWVWMEQP